MKRVFIFITAVFAFLYLVGTLMFFGRYPFRTSVEGINATYKTPGEVSLELMRRTQNQAIEFIVPDGDDERLVYGQLGIFRVSEMEEANTRVNPFLWPVSLFRDTEYHLDQELSYNPTTLRNCLSQLLFVKNGTKEWKSTFPTDLRIKRTPATKNQQERDLLKLPNAFNCQWTKPPTRQVWEK